jgi:hypothetical protein
MLRLRTTFTTTMGIFLGRHCIFDSGSVLEMVVYYAFPIIIFFVIVSIL